ncbi:FlgO family outer membrane protein [Lacimicrobium alkaliphilum]|uniref:FlgO domain-containing protein n=1 Tax=Lacimicrobium alkaliphilum TaxID=1526571 RepID=A0ABQ1R235_9ALTE|nr:FlgO family outer membrane protein [Lacimicrobium alkaliphilum]GGD55513.1 hypothetical protein GCM10011357_08920 [Lacimicrobium alkaliphilum]
MTQLFTILILIIMLAGCATFDIETPDEHSNGAFQPATFKSSNAAENEFINSVQLQDYVRETVAEMALNMKNVAPDASVAVTSFVLLDSGYQSSSLLGQQLSEAFMAELHRFGINTLDYKVSDYIRVTPQGDFILTRDYLELDEEISAKLALVGTMTKHANGILVQTRIVDIETKSILSAGTSLIPHRQVNALFSGSAM